MTPLVICYSREKMLDQLQNNLCFLTLTLRKPFINADEQKKKLCSFHAIVLDEVLFFYFSFVESIYFEKDLFHSNANNLQTDNHNVYRRQRIFLSKKYF